MKIDIVGGGPGGLYAALLLKKADQSRSITVYDRNPPDATYGWGVVFSDETLGFLEDADREAYDAIARTFVRWDAIDIFYGGERIRSGGHAFSGLSRKHLLAILQHRCLQVGVQLRYRQEVTGEPHADLVIAADGLNSGIRQGHVDAFRPSFDVHSTKYIWLGVQMRFEAFTFVFRETEHGMFQVHAYPFDENMSTFIVECNETAWRAAGLHLAGEAESLLFCEGLFGDVLAGRPLLSNRSTWINFTTLRNESWRFRNIVLLGDAAHTAHFSVGSGTKLAMEDAIALAGALDKFPNDLQAALVEYEELRQPYVERTQMAARESSFWFENSDRYSRLEPTEFAFSLLTRSKRVTYENLQLRDPGFVRQVDAWFATESGNLGNSLDTPSPPPRETELSLGSVMFPNRLVGIAESDDAPVGIPGIEQVRAIRALSRTRGMVLVGSAAVAVDGRITSNSAGIYTFEQECCWLGLVELVHETTTKIGIQLVHAGPRGATRPRKEGIDLPLRDGGWSLISASPNPYTRHSFVPRAMDDADMDRVCRDFRESAVRAARAGFDLLELHCGHGYLLGSFISPISNKRSDGYGGSLENRLRFPLRVFDAVREVWPVGRPLSVGFSVSDWASGGITDADSIQIACTLHAHGCDLIHVLTGQSTGNAAPVFGKAWQAHHADRIRNDAQVPVMVGGGISTADEVNTLLAAGRADLCIVTGDWSAAPSRTAALTPPRALVREDTR